MRYSFLRTVLFLLSFMAMSKPIQAEEINPFEGHLTGSNLYELCSVLGSSKNISELTKHKNGTACVSYIKGVTETLPYSLMVQDKMQICMPESEEGSAYIVRLIKAFNHQAETRPESLSGPAPLVLMLAYSLAFPCKK